MSSSRKKVQIVLPPLPSRAAAAAPRPTLPAHPTTLSTTLKTRPKTLRPTTKARPVTVRPPIVVSQEIPEGNFNIHEYSLLLKNIEATHGNTIILDKLSVRHLIGLARMYEFIPEEEVFLLRLREQINDFFNYKYSIEFKKIKTPDEISECKEIVSNIIDLGDSKYSFTNKNKPYYKCSFNINSQSFDCIMGQSHRNALNINNYPVLFAWIKPFTIGKITFKIQCMVNIGKENENASISLIATSYNMDWEDSDLRLNLLKELLKVVYYKIIYEASALLPPTLELYTVTLTPNNYGTISFYPHYKRFYPISFTEETSPFNPSNAGGAPILTNILPYRMEEQQEIKYQKHPTLQGMLVDTTLDLPREDRNICHYDIVYYPKRKIVITLKIMHRNVKNYFERVHLLNTALEGQLLENIVYTAIYDGAINKGYYAPKTKKEKDNWPPKEFKYNVTIITNTDGARGMLGNSTTALYKVSV